MRLIDADALKKQYYPFPCAIGVENAVTIRAINEAPTIDAAPVVRGEWSQRSCFDENENVYVCSVCDEPWTLIAGTPLENNMRHCPNCGAKMESEGST